ncbi:MAG: pyruvate, phosphate dikinase [Alphaproteobacteria bacterium TMED87]|nr:pyruvate, phosphate dikinase [Rhodospirillaceae bacterium]OUV11791.1 MAG: pyruvate, phosphate dikinase [Alphaproteobacteria bacterium TMED87]
MGYKMRDNALEKAIEFIGGTVALAKAISVTSQAISQWDRVPAERVIAVEEATKGNITRYQLRPDLYPEPNSQSPQNDPVKNKWVYFFGAGDADGTALDGDLLGGKGANLAEMTRIGIPVPPGFTITSNTCHYFYSNKGSFPVNLEQAVSNGISKIEAIINRKFGDKTNPMLLSVRSGARASMPGMMDTVLNLGLNDETVIGLAKNSGDKRFAFDSYRRFLQMYSDVVLEVDSYKFEEILDTLKFDNGINEDADLSEDNLVSLVEEYKLLIEKETGKGFPQDVQQQLWGAISAVFKSWMNKRAITYRSLHNIPDAWGTAVNIQAMVFGNMGDDCATGVCFSRDPSNGENQIYGEYLINAQGEDVVAGIRTPQQLSIHGKIAQNSELPSMEESMPKVYSEILEIRKILEGHYKDMQDMEFTIQKGKLWMLQTRSGKRTAKASIQIAVDMANEKLISRDEAVERVNPEQLDQLLHPMLDPEDNSPLLTRGLPASPGAASGKVVFNSKEAEDWVRKGEEVILVRRETSPEDIAGMHVAKGILTTRGGMTSHAAVVARGMGTPCVSGAGEVQVFETENYLSIKEVMIYEGDIITIDGTSGSIFNGRVGTIEPQLTGAFGILMKWVDEIREMKIRTNAETEEEARVARKFGAEGIGLCRTEHMFFDQGRIINIRQMILATDEGGRINALSKLLPYQKDDFLKLFKIMDGLPVTIRLLDPPLHEFLPHSEKEKIEVAESTGVSLETVNNALNKLTEINPMLGHRGCRLGVTYPEIYKMQVSAIFQAAIQIVKDGKTVLPEIMVPLITERKEFDFIRDIIDTIANEIFDKEELRFDYKIGTMIELPRAALCAEELAETAEFFSFGTNDLTQTTFGISRDDCAPILEVYLKKEIYENDPFSSIDKKGVGELIKIASQKGKLIRPSIKLGICGEHGGDPRSIEFCQKIGLDYVSCSPYRVPVARLSAAQAALKEFSN